MDSAAVVIAQLATPVVMISAAGLLCLGLFNRLATLVARSRAFAKERVELIRTIASPAEGMAGAALDRLRLEALEAHSARVLKRATLLRASLQCILAAILAMLASSAAIGLSIFSSDLWVWALICFGVGLAAMAAGVILVMAELAQALRDVKLEQRLLNEFENLSDGFAVAGK
ncbi:MAG: DUF2721 domain-containing protein [Leptolyngbya sp. PLA3]|nr:MAG: DUF2721 domain-containing protein [Cyanobacteria bacterium CYA]MCE7969068.1 DUF2721 domain-containing protein [Leptolyngbya sp. PL-A3]